MEVKCVSFNELSVAELYDVLQLRSAIFVVEQQCIYLDPDNKDKQCYHLLLYEQQLLVAYARLIPPGISYHECSIGRIVTRTHGQGHGNFLMQEAMKQMEALFGKQPIRISAQCYARQFYEKFDFIQDSDVYNEDGIAHMAMLRK